MQKTILIIGSGRRVRQTLLPAVLCLRKHIRLIGVLATSRKTVIDQSPFGSIQTITTLDSVDFRTVDIIMIAVTTEQVPSVLQTLRAYDTRHIVLFMDTPVLRMRHFFALRYLQFRSVYVTEDYWSSPKLTEIQHIIQKGTIGDMQHSYFFHNAYKHHGIAMMKKVSSCQTITWARKIRVGSGIHEIRLRLEGTRVTVFEPRDYAVGRLLVAAKKGFLADFPLMGKKGMLLINTSSGFTITANQTTIKHFEYRYSHLARRYVPKELEFHIDKIEGVIRMLESVRVNQTAYLYSLSFGLYDTIVASCIERFGFFVDWTVPIIRRSLVLCCIQTLIWGLRMSDRKILFLTNKP